MRLCWLHESSGPARQQHSACRNRKQTMESRIGSPRNTSASETASPVKASSLSAKQIKHNAKHVAQQCVRSQSRLVRRLTSSFSASSSAGAAAGSGQKSIAFDLFCVHIIWRKSSSDLYAMKKFFISESIQPRQRTSGTSDFAVDTLINATSLNPLWTCQTDMMHLAIADRCPDPTCMCTAVLRRHIRDSMTHNYNDRPQGTTVISRVPLILSKLFAATSAETSLLFFLHRDESSG